MGTEKMLSGRNYWEIKITKCVKIDGLIIGIARRQFQTDENPIKSPNFLGYIS
jgi:hypothetical protein